MKKGNQTPTQSFVLTYRKTKGQEAIDLYNETGRTCQYRKVKVNIYAPKVAISKLCEDYAKSINGIANVEKFKALSMIEIAKDRLTAVQSIISRIDYVNPSH